MKSFQEERIKQGLCPRCGRPRKPGFQLCDDHQRLNIVWQRRYKARLRGHAGNAMAVYRDRRGRPPKRVEVDPEAHEGVDGMINLLRSEVAQLAAD